jgi:hypothetical protein
MNTATFFITSARSGTQWQCHTLRTIYADLLAVEHEPVGYAYSPKRYLRNPAAGAELRRNPAVRQHLDDIHRTLKTKSYVEVGFPAFAAAPLLWEEFGEQLRLVQLVRHPIRVAASIVTHRWFEPGYRADIQADIALAPSDPGALLRHYEARWAGMSAFEKALFYWTEVHLYGLEVQEKFLPVPFLRIKLESLLTEANSRAQMARFLGLPYRPAWNDAPGHQVDAYYRQTSSRIDSQGIRSLPEAADLATRFGYDIEAIATSEIRQRYQRSLFSIVNRRAKRAVRKTFAAGAAADLAVSQYGEMLARCF